MLWIRRCKDVRTGYTEILGDMYDQGLVDQFIYEKLKSIYSDLILIFVPLLMYCVLDFNALCLQYFKTQEVFVYIFCKEIFNFNWQRVWKRIMCEIERVEGMFGNFWPNKEAINCSFHKFDKIVLDFKIWICEYFVCKVLLYFPINEICLQNYIIRTFLVEQYRFYDIRFKIVV